MNPRAKKLVRFGIAGVICAFALFVAYRVWDRQQMVRATREWARLSPFPASAQHFSVQSEGSMFSRAFRVSFTAPVSDIDGWLRESPGTREITPERPSPTTRRFLISPGGGAQHAEVTVDNRTGLVRVYVYWS